MTLDEFDEISTWDDLITTANDYEFDSCVEDIYSKDAVCEYLQNGVPTRSYDLDDWANFANEVVEIDTRCDYFYRDVGFVGVSDGDREFELTKSRLRELMMEYDEFDPDDDEDYDEDEYDEDDEPFTSAQLTDDGNNGFYTKFAPLEIQGTANEDIGERLLNELLGRSIVQRL